MAPVRSRAHPSCVASHASRPWSSLVGRLIAAELASLLPERQVRVALEPALPAGCPSGMGYHALVAIVACPFCREMFEEGEAERCPVCGMQLQPFEKLPPSPHALAEVDEDGIPYEPH